jgi:hypothetical protein
MLALLSEVEAASGVMTDISEMRWQPLNQMR